MSNDKLFGQSFLVQMMGKDFVLQIMVIFKKSVA